MIISLALLLPIVLVLYWIYWLAGDKALRLAELWVLSLTILAVTLATCLTHYQLRDWQQGIWPYLLAPMVGYGVLLVGLSVCLIIRRKYSCRPTSG